MFYKREHLNLQCRIPLSR